MAVTPVWFLIFFFLCSGLFFGAGLFAAGVAYVKGYRPWFWLIPLGPVGALLMLLRPNLNRATTPEEREQWEQRADWTGGVLSGITLFCMMAMPIAGVMLIFSLRSVAVTRTPAVIAAPPQAVNVVIKSANDSEGSTENESPGENSNSAGEPSTDAGLDRPRIPETGTPSTEGNTP